MVVAQVSVGLKTRRTDLTLARGARQLVVQEALETTCNEESYWVWLTPMTNMGVLSLGGAEMTT